MQKAFASHEQFSCVLQQRPFSDIDIGKPEMEMICTINSILRSSFYQCQEFTQVIVTIFGHTDSGY